MSPVVVGAIVNSALYLVCAFAAGLTFGPRIAWQLALAAMGVTYLSYIAQMRPLFIEGSPMARTLASTLVCLSIVLGATAGIALLFRY